MNIGLYLTKEEIHKLIVDQSDDNLHAPGKNRLYEVTLVIKTESDATELFGPVMGA